MEVRGKKLCQRTDLGVFEQQELLAVVVEADLGFHFGGAAGEFEDGARPETIVFNSLSYS